MMCGRYRIDDGKDSIELHEIIEEVNRRVVVEPIKTSGDVFPTDTAPVIANSRSMTPTPFAMQWGYTLPDGKRIINARSETAESKTLFRDGMLQRRCAVPATNYYEWEKTGSGRTKYAIWPTDSDLFYMAGIYRIEAGKPVFSILTRDPADSISFIHNRMPVILPHDMMKDWLNPRYAASDLLKNAVLSVAYEKEAGNEQMHMTF